jgi:hypothetical protein
MSICFFFKWLYVELLLITIILGTNCQLSTSFNFPTILLILHYVSIDGFVGPCPRDTDYGIGSNFWKFYLIRTSFTLGEPVSLVKVFRLFRLEWIVLVFRVWTQYNFLSIGRASMSMMPCFLFLQFINTTKQLEYQNYHFWKLNLAFTLQQTFGSNYVANHTQLMV